MFLFPLPVGERVRVRGILPAGDTEFPLIWPSATFSPKGEKEQVLACVVVVSDVDDDFCNPRRLAIDRPRLDAQPVIGDCFHFV